MKHMRVLRTAAVMMVSLSVFTTTVSAATAYKDVPETHWASQAISEVAEKGLMVGDASGNFKPDEFIDKFETAKILAKTTGYKYVNVSAEEKIYFDRAYEKNKEFLSQFNKAFTKWNSSADRETAYLLEKEILTVDDMNQYVIKNADGTEQLRALSRQEAAVFLVRLIGQKTEALSLSYKPDFKDDASIGAVNKPYVYYLKSKGVITGDTDGKFNPNSAVTKASLAVMLTKTLALMNGSGTAVPAATPGVSQNLGSAAQISKVETVSGTFDMYYLALKFVQIISADNSKNIYKLSDNATIFIDSYLKTADDLKAGMTVTCVINNNEIVDIKAQSITTDTSTQPVTNLSLSTLEGIVAGTADEAAGKTINIEVRMLNPKGEIITDTKSYSLSADCVITRGDTGVETGFTSINAGDVVKAEISGSKVYSLKLEEKNRTIKDGTLIEKKYISSSSTPILVIQDQNGTKMELRVIDKTKISRKDMGDTTWNNLRVGDGIDASCEYDKLLTVYAYGIRSTVEGTVEDIFISRDTSSISVKSSDGTVKNYKIIIGTVDVYTLRVGMKLRLQLDSMETEGVTILEEAGTSYVTGYIQNFKTNTFSISDAVNKYVAAREIKVDGNTVYMDSKTGGRIQFSNLYENMKVYVVLSGNSSNLAKSVTVLTE